MCRLPFLLTGALVLGARAPRGIEGEMRTAPAFMQEAPRRPAGPRGLTVNLGFQIRPLPFPIQLSALPPLPVSLGGPAAPPTASGPLFDDPIQIFGRAALGPLRSLAPGHLLGTGPEGAEGGAEPGDPSVVATPVRRSFRHSSSLSSLRLLFASGEGESSGATGPVFNPVRQGFRKAVTRASSLRSNPTSNSGSRRRVPSPNGYR